MLYVFYGTDVQASRKKAHTLIDALRAKRPDAAYESMTAENWDTSVLEGNLGGQGLFSNKYIIFLDRVTEHAEAKEELPSFIPAMKESANIFIVLEGKVLADLKKAFEKHAEKVVGSDLAESKNKKLDFNIFALADALGARDRLRAWKIYREAVDNGIESESIIGTLFWQAKSIALASAAPSASAAGLSPFVYTKSKRYAAQYSKEEMNALLTRLITLYHDGHRGLADLELATEKLLLEI